MIDNNNYKKFNLDIFFFKWKTLMQSLKNFADNTGYFPIADSAAKTKPAAPFSKVVKVSLLSALVGWYFLHTL